MKANTVVWEIGKLSVPVWLPEIDQMIPSDPVFAGISTPPRRLSGMINVSSRLLKQQASLDLVRVLVSGLSRQLGSFLDQTCLYGSGSADNQPQGLVGLAGVQSITIDPVNLHPSFCAAEKLIKDQNIEMSSYGVLA